MASGVSGQKKPTLCRYFMSAGSCMYGDECQFLHQNPGQGVGFQKPFSNGPAGSAPHENQGGPFDMMGNNGDQYFNATFDSDNGTTEFHPFSQRQRPMPRGGGNSAAAAHRSAIMNQLQQGMKPFGNPGPRMEGPMSNHMNNDGQGPIGPGMDRPPNPMMEVFAARMNGPNGPMPSRMDGPNTNGPGNNRMDQNLATDFAALNLSVPSSSKGPNPIANEFIPKNGPLTHSASSPNFSTFSGHEGMLPDTSTAPPGTHMMNNQMSHMGGGMGMPPGGPLMNSHPVSQMSNTPPPTHLATTTAYSAASPNHSPHLSPSNSPLMLRRTASPIAALKTNTTPKKSVNNTIQENVGGTTYFYSPEDFTPYTEGTTLPDFSMFPSLPPHIAHMSVKKNMPQFFMPDELKMDILNRNALTMAQIDLSQNPDIPTEVDTYHNLFPLEPPVTNPMQKSNRFGYPTTCYKAVNTKDGLTYCLRRVHGFRLSNTKVMSIIDMWKKMYHPNIVQLREVFTTKVFGDNSIVFVYDYFATSETLMNHHFNNPAAMNGSHAFSLDPNSRSFNSNLGGGNGGKSGMSNPRQHAGLLPESLIWAYVVQLSSALRAIHAAGLACRTMDPTKILLYSKSRLRLNCVGILDVLTFDSNQANPMAVVQHYQQEDLVYMGRVVLALACNTMMALQRDNFQTSMELVARNYSADLKNFFFCLLTNQSRPRSINDIMPMIGARFYTQLDSAQLRSDVIENELAKEVENGRLFRLMCKLGNINDRPEFNMDPQWSETGDRYMLKLFRDYLFHQVDANGVPWIDMAHIVQCLNKLDAGVPEKICLMSRDEHSVLVVSYSELRRNFEQAFSELVSAGQQSTYS